MGVVTEDIHVSTVDNAPNRELVDVDQYIPETDKESSMKEENNKSFYAVH